MQSAKNKSGSIIKDQKDSFEIMYTNADCLSNKLKELEVVANSIKPKLIAITEVKHKNKWHLCDSELQLSGYKFFSNDLGKDGRGVVIYVSEKLECNSVVLDTDYNDAVVVEIKVNNNETMLVGNFYRSPNSCAENDNKLFALINAICESYLCSKILVGDFNLPNIDWGNCSSNCAISKKFLSTVQKNFLIQHVFKPTRVRGTDRANILDLVLTDNPSLVHDIELLSPLGKSDHAILTINCNIQASVSNRESDKFNYSKGDYVKFREILNIDWVAVFTDLNNDVDSMWDYFKDVMHKGMEEFIPKLTDFNKWRKSSWRRPLDQDLRVKIRKKARLWTRFMETRNPQILKGYKKVRNDIRKITRQLAKKEQCEIANQCKSNPKKFWKYVNSKSRLRNPIGNLKVADVSGSTVVDDDQEKANVLGKFFASVFTREPSGSFSTMAPRPAEFPCGTIGFTEDIILHKLNKLNITKSSGPDLLHPRILHEVRHQIATPLQLIFEASFRNGTLPYDWRIANTVPIHKKGSKAEPNNYRPVSLTSAVCKLMESIIRDHLMEYVLTNIFISKNQYGFIKGRSTVLQLLKIFDDWTECLESGGQIDCVYMDFEKAFDTVPHERLISKLKSYNIDSTIINWVSAFLKGRNFKVIVNGKCSCSFDVISGIPQGSILGPLLFIIYINDLPDECSSLLSKLNIYADDTKLYGHILQREDQCMLQQDIDKIKTWADRWLLKLNVNKCKVVSYALRDVISTSYFIQEGNKCLELDKLDSFKDLGVVFDKGLTFGDHMHEKISKAYSVLGIIKRNFIHMNSHSFILLYKSMVRPHLEYANGVWCPYRKGDIEAIEKVQKRATKLVISVKHLQYEERLHRLKLPTLKYRRLRGDMIEVFKLLNNLYDKDVDFKLRLKPAYSTRGNSYKLENYSFHYDVRKFSFCPRVVNVWNSLPDHVVNVATVNMFKAHLDKFWEHQQVVFDFKAELTGTGNRSEYIYNL